MSKNRAISTTVIAVLAILYVAVRFWGLTASCLWFDEIFGVHAAQHSWNTILSFVAQDLIHPPLFYILLKLWITVGGESVYWLRMFPVIFACLSIVPFMFLCKELRIGRTATAIAFFLVAINGSLIKYAQEVRMYSLLQFLSLVSIWLFVRYFRKGKNLVPLIIVNILLVHSHYFGWFVVSAEVLAIIAFQRIKVRAILLMLVVTAVSFIPWAVAVWRFASAGADVGQNIGWMQKPGIVEISQFVFNLVEPFYYAASSIDPVSVFRITLPILAILVAAVVLFLVDWKKYTEEDRETTKLLLLCVSAPLIIAFIASWAMPNSIWGTRHLIIVFAPFSILAGVAIAKISFPFLRVAAMTLIVLFGGYAFFNSAQREAVTYSWCAWEPLAVEAKSLSAANIYAFEDLTAYHLWFGELSNQTNAKVFRVENIDGLVEDKAYFLPRGFDEVKRVDFVSIDEPRLWIAFRAKNLTEKEPPLRNFLVKGYHVVDQKIMTAGTEKAIFLLLEK